MGSDWQIFGRHKKKYGLTFYLKKNSAIVKYGENFYFKKKTKHVVTKTVYNVYGGCS